MTKLDLDALQALAEAATPGPWAQPDMERPLISGKDLSGRWAGMIATVDAGDYARSRAEGLANAAFIAASRTAVPALVERIRELEAEAKLLREENGSLIDENSDLRCEPWPEWASAVLKVIRDHSGYDGYDDAMDGVDLPAELGECFSELESFAEGQKARAEAAEAENERLREAAMDLAEYASYAEIVGGIRENRSPIRRCCDEIFRINSEIEARRQS